MSKIKEVFLSKSGKASGYYLIGNLFDKAIVFLTIPIFTRLLSTSDYGIVNTYLSWVTILSVIIGLSLGNTIRNAYIDFKDELDEYISSILFLSVISFVSTSAIIIYLSLVFINTIDILLVVFCLVHSFMLFIINTASMKYMISSKYIKRTLLLAAPNILITLLSIYLLLSTDYSEYLARILSYVFIFSVLAIIILVAYLFKGRKLIVMKYWKYGLVLSIPLIFHGLSINILTASDRTMLIIFTNASETGIYSLIYSFSMIALVFSSSLGSVWIPWFNKKMLEKNKKIINSAAEIYIEFVSICMLGILLISPEILKIMAPPEYWGGNTWIPLILLSSFFIFLYSLSVDLEYFYKSTKIIAINTTIAAVLNIILNIVFIPQYGGVGAAIATLISYVLSFFMHYKSARILDNELFPFRIYLKSIFYMTISTVLYYLFIELPVVRWSILSICILIYLISVVKSNKLEALR